MSYFTLLLWKHEIHEEFLNSVYSTYLCQNFKNLKWMLSILIIRRSDTKFGKISSRDFHLKIGIDRKDPKSVGFVMTILIPWLLKSQTNQIRFSK
jgi:hypothetical protein